MEIQVWINISALNDVLLVSHLFHVRELRNDPHSLRSDVGQNKQGRLSNQADVLFNLPRDATTSFEIPEMWTFKEILRYRAIPSN